MAKATLEGIPLLDSREISWPIREGTDPVMVEFDIIPDSLPLLLDLARAKNGDITLIIEDVQPGTKELRENKFSGLWILGPGVPSHPRRKAILVSDRRWRWHSPLISKSYNLRRRVGVQRRGLWQDALQQDTVPVWNWFSWSLNGGKPWTADEIIFDVLLQLGEGVAFTKEEQADFDLLRKLPIENMVLNDPGDEALSKALNQMPGIGIYLDNKSNVRIYNKLTGKETLVVGKGGELPATGSAGPEIEGTGGHVEFITNEFTRPSAVDVFFTIESELRFDFLGDDNDSTSIDFNDPFGILSLLFPPRLMDNVISQPDFILDINGVKHYQGQYITYNQYLPAITENAGLLANLDNDAINTAMIPDLGLWAVLDLLGKIELSATDANWSARIRGIQSSWRQLFRISPNWKERILAMRPYLVATNDVTSGQRAPAQAWADHSYRISRKSLFLRARKNENLAWGMNVPSYPGFNADPGSTAGRVEQVAPATISIEDEDQGIIRINYQVDPYGQRDQVFPAFINNMPSHNLRNSNRGTPIAFNAIAGNGRDFAKFRDDQRTAVLITCVPSIPNDKRRFYRIRVTPSEVKSLLPTAAQKSLNKASGPVREIFVGPGVETARVQFRASQSDRINQIFGVPRTVDDIRSVIRDLVINDRPQAAIGLDSASLPNIAVAIAATIYSDHRDRVQGMGTYRMDAELGLLGNMDEINNVLGTDGKAHSIVGLPPQVEPVSIFQFMDPSARQIILRNLIPQAVT